jgi:glycosyltransferase involved in cell wall biosynthesis
VTDDVRVLVDGRSFTNDSKFRGIGTFARNLFPGLAQEPGIRLDVLAERDPGFGLAWRRVRRYAPSRWSTREHDLRLPVDLARAACDVFHSPALDPPRRSPVPWVQTLHDVIPLVFDDPRYAVDRRRWLRYGPRLAEAAAVITDAASTADDAVRVLGLDRRRIEVVPLAVDPDFLVEGSRDRRDPPALLFVGEFDPRKGHAEAVDVFGLVADRGHPHRLRMAGRIAPWVDAELRGLVARSRHAGRIDLLGFVADLVPEYDAADVFVWTTRYEGFGLPALEALARGTPVVAFDNSCIREVLGDAAVIVADGDVAALAGEVDRLLRDPVLWQEMSDRGRARAATFSWARAVQAHCDIYRAVAAS